MLRLLNQKLRRLCSRLRRRMRRSQPKTKIAIHRLGIRPAAKPYQNGAPAAADDSAAKTIRIATFNAAMFSMAPAVPTADAPLSGAGFRSGDDCLNPISKKRLDFDIGAKLANDRPRSILKRSPSCSFPAVNAGRSKPRVSINLPDNEISLERTRQLNFAGANDDEAGPSTPPPDRRHRRGKDPLRNSWSFPARPWAAVGGGGWWRNERTVLEVVKEVGADILALQDVKADEEKGMKPLSDLAEALGMKYVFAESWAPEYGNAVLSRWPIKRWKVQKIIDDTDFRNVLKVTVDVPQIGEVNFHCTRLDHLDENWRMKQITAIIQSEDVPHILAGGLNSLDETDYSAERWTDIVKYYEEIGKPTPKAEVMRFLKGKKYQDAKDFAGECESVVIIAKGQAVQGTCKYGTRVDYILASPNSPYMFVPNSYSVLSSKGTSDHHIVRVDVMVSKERLGNADSIAGRQQPKKRVVKLTNPSSSSRGIWGINS